MNEPPTARQGLGIDRTWDGEDAGAEERVRIDATFGPDGLELRVDAPFHGDPPPAHPPGPTPRLWEHEVVEVFLLGDDGRYLEVELGPRGHYLVLELHGVRNVVRDELPLSFAATIDGGRWTGHAFIPAALLPPGLARWNAYAIHGQGDRRRYLCHAPTYGARPDFHRLEAFVPIGSATAPEPGSGTPR